MATDFPDPDWTKIFLSTLAPTATAFCFRTFDDVKGRINHSLARKLDGAFHQVADQLRHLNDQRAGVFVVINEGGQTDAEITRIRAVFADTDGAPLEPLLDALQPHIVVCSSPGNYHVYWLVDDQFPVPEFTPIQLAIAEKYGTDRKVSNPSRVMRLPGFNHHKKDPELVAVYSSFGPAKLYSVADVVQGLGLFTQAARKTSVGPELGISGDMVELERALTFINPFVERDLWRNVLFAISDAFGEAGRELARRWSRGDLWEGTA